MYYEVRFYLELIEYDLQQGQGQTVAPGGRKWWLVMLRQLA